MDTNNPKPRLLRKACTEKKIRQIEEDQLEVGSYSASQFDRRLVLVRNKVLLSSVLMQVKVSPKPASDYRRFPNYGLFLTA